MKINVKNYKFLFCFAQMWNADSYIKGRALFAVVREQVSEENVWT